MKTINTTQLNNGCFKSRDFRNNIGDFAGGQTQLQTRNGKLFTANRRLLGKKLAQGQKVAAYCNQHNQHFAVYEILGFSDHEVAYGEGGVKFDSAQAALNHYAKRSLNDLFWYFDETQEYGHGVYLIVRDIETGDEGPWFPLDEGGRWTYGSGAEKLSFILVDEIQQ